MIIDYSKPLLAGLALSSRGDPHHRSRCSFGDPCWPSQSEWNAFNTSISGRLIASMPSAAACHREAYDTDDCKEARQHWNDSFWRTSQVGAYSGILWELGDDQCFINSPVDAPCEPGLVPHYSVAAQEVSDIQSAVKFASRHDLYLVVKNTGHEHLGRSSGKGAFSIWTHNLEGREWHDASLVKGTPKGAQGIPAVTLQAGEQWLDVYRDASVHNVIVVGGSARTVGAAGGWLTGGGHSPFSHFYGLGADDLLEVNIVTPSGEHKTLNAYNDPEYFWAVRGGGGSAWGVITSVTYKTHPNPSHIQVGFAQFNVTDKLALQTVLEEVLSALPSITDARFTGYGTTFDGAGFGAIFIQPNATNATCEAALAPLQKIAGLPNVAGQVGCASFPTWMDYCDAFLQDPNVATNVIDTSRLLTADVLLNHNKELVDVTFDYPDMSAGFNFIGKVNSEERDNTAVHPIWKDSRAIFSLGANWADDAPAAEKKLKKQHAVEVSKRLAKIVGPDGGTYMNEANPYEPYWQDAFWGPKYNRLLKVKRRIDPRNLFVCNRCVGTDVVYEP